jgi:Cupin-like domain
MPNAIADIDPSDAAALAALLASSEPGVLRGLAADWPVVAAASNGDAAVLAYLGKTMAAQDIEFAQAPPEVHGRFHYSEDMRGFTFERRRLPAQEFLNALAAELPSEQPCALAAQGIVAHIAAPAFEIANPLPLRPGSGEARLWIGNRARVAAHSDPADNIAYCAAGRRRFTLFAPEQVGNLYLGPFEPTPAGTPIAMTDPVEPDFARYPRFVAAMEAAQVAELEPGDAVFIPYGWFHHVQALSPVSMLVNYWWNDGPPGAGSAWDVLLHAFMALRPLSPKARRYWAAMLLHYGLEQDGPAGSHLPPHARGVLDARSPQDLNAMRAALLRNLSRGG